MVSFLKPGPTHPAPSWRPTPRSRSPQIVSSCRHFMDQAGFPDKFSRMMAVGTIPCHVNNNHEHGRHAHPRRAPRSWPVSSPGYLPSSHYFPLFFLLPSPSLRVKAQSLPLLAGPASSQKPCSRHSQNKGSLLPERNHSESNFLRLITHTGVGILLNLGQL